MRLKITNSVEKVHDASRTQTAGFQEETELQPSQLPRNLYRLADPRLAHNREKAALHSLLLFNIKTY